MATQKSRFEFVLTLTAEFQPELGEDQEFNLAKAEKALVSSIRSTVVEAIENNGLIADYTARGESVEVNVTTSKVKLRPAPQAA